MTCKNDKILYHRPLDEPIQTQLHEHNHTHEHSYAHGAKDRKILRIAIIITAVAMLVQLIYSVLTNSLALLSDTLHMFSHVFALILSYFAIWLSERNGGSERTFGFWRAEVIVAFVNSITTAIFVVFILYEAVEKLLNPQPIDAKTLVIIAVLGLLVNAITGALLLKADMQNLNIKSSFLHMMSDLLSSMGVVVGGVIVWLTGALWVDALLALLIAFMIGRWSYSLVRQSVEVLLESSPVALAQVRSELEAHPMVLGAHDIHVSQITRNMLVLTAHIEISPQNALNFPQISRELSAQMLARFTIGHCTFEPEWRQIWRVASGKNKILNPTKE